MIRDSLREALARMADTPPVWIAGLYLGALFALDILIPAAGNAVVGARIGFLGLCALPFFLGGTYGAIRGDAPGLREYLAAGTRYYFRILLPGAVIVAAAFATVLLLMFPLSLAGGSSQALLPVAAFGVGIPFTFFTFFFDTAAVFEGRKVFDSIRRSVEFVTKSPGGALSFYLVNLAVGILALFFGVFLWSFTIADRVQPLVEANQTLFQNMTAAQLVSIIGVPGVEAGAVIGFLAVTVGATLLLSFKACFYRRASLSVPPPGPSQGEFDEKGRWFKY